MAERATILIFSGEIGTGKTSISNNLSEIYNFKIFKTNEVLKKIGQKEGIDRSNLQKFGNNLDKKSNGKWVLDAFNKEYGSEFNINHKKFIIDAARIESQINEFRNSYGYSIFHIHLKSPDDVLKNRFKKRESHKFNSKELEANYLKYKSDKTEKEVKNLEKIADLVLDTSKTNISDSTLIIASYLDLIEPNISKNVDVIIGGQFGSEGKGQIAGYIAPEYDCLIRVGGPNAGHTVFESPENHVFHLIPSGTYRNQNAKLILGPGCVISEKKIFEEIMKYISEDNPDRLLIDENAIIISNEDIEYEERLKKKISSTAQGVGHATANNILARLNASDKHKAKNNSRLKQFIGNSSEELNKYLISDKKILLEGTQGTLLSIHHGFYPYVTSRDTTVSGCISEAGISPKNVNKIILVTRSYPIRVGGTSGDFGSKEITWEEISKRSGIDLNDLIKNERTTTTKKERRVAEFSWELFRKACTLNSPTDIAVTFTDYFSISNNNAYNYNQLTLETRNFIENIERVSGVNASMISTGFNYRSIIDRRNW